MPNVACEQLCLYPVSQEYETSIDCWVGCGASSSVSSACLWFTFLCVLQIDFWSEGKQSREMFTASFKDV